MGVPLRRRTVTGIFVPSRDTAVSATTSVSEKLTGDLRTSAVRTTFPSGPARYQAEGST